MARIKKNEGEIVELNKVRGMVRKELEKKYGSITKFLNSEKGKELGGMKIKAYLYDTGSVNFEVISALCKYLGIGELTRKIVVSRVISYRLCTNVPTTEKTS